MKNHARNFFRPDRTKALLCGGLCVIALLGSIDGYYAFSDYEFFPDRPPFFLDDILRSLSKLLPFWVIWMYVLIPLALLTTPLKYLGIDVLHGPLWLFVAANVMYFYCLSCVLVFGVRRLLKETRESGWRRR